MSNVTPLPVPDLVDTVDDEVLASPVDLGDLDDEDDED